MKALFYLLIFGRLPCSHEWEVIDKGVIQKVIDKTQSGTWYDCRCKKCGSIKCFKV